MTTPDPLDTTQDRQDSMTTGSDTRVGADSMMEMARLICAKHCNDSQIGKYVAEGFLEGRYDGDNQMQIALAAIKEERERCAKVAEAVHQSERRDDVERLREGERLREAKVWRVEGWDGDEPFAFNFTCEKEYERFLRERPAGASVTDIHEAYQHSAADALSALTPDSQGDA